MCVGVFFLGGVGGYVCVFVCLFVCFFNLLVYNVQKGILVYIDQC